MPEVVVEDILDGVEIIDITNDDKATSEKQKNRLYEVSRRCQIIGTEQHPLAKMVRGDRDTIVYLVKCIICSSVKGKLVTISPKSDTLEKHARNHIATKDLLVIGIKKDETYIFKNCRHLKVGATYYAKNLHAPTIFDKI